MLRRLVALILMLCFGLFTAEALLADTHDGDATHEELVRVDGMGDHVAAHIAHGDAPHDAHIGAQPDAPDHHPGERAPGESGHAQHACHCAHTHGGWLQLATTLPVMLADAHLAPIAFGDQAPSSHDAEPQLRPPIA